MNSLFAEGVVRDHTETMMRDAARARLVRKVNACRKARRGRSRTGADR